MLFAQLVKSILEKLRAICFSIRRSHQYLKKISHYWQLPFTFQFTLNALFHVDQQFRHQGQAFWMLQSQSIQAHQYKAYLDLLIKSKR
ncbi:hypothetical protein FGO68_gene16881 [Halteria grandinella]|uniref:Uncharacterized protein n=1 Tax=Halteria grandinella TaxID=5974 RepID=A0A8J8NEC0_HALGN|nr:hypothetical protein FGO68_gene16881 [Halteria grandinella]